MNKFLALIVEDDEHKMRSLASFFSDEIPAARVHIAQSLSSAIKKLGAEEFNVAIVDMSLPTFDLAIDKAGGGQPQGFGGSDILRFIESESPTTVSIVVTQYDEFPSTADGPAKSLNELAEELKIELGANFGGVLFYSGQHGEWRQQLKAIIAQYIKNHD